VFPFGLKDTESIASHSSFWYSISMDMGNFNLFIKMIREEYKLDESQLQTMTYRLLADDKEFEKVWKLYKGKSRRISGGVDEFKFLLQELVS
jgi:hypothetical protein